MLKRLTKRTLRPISRRIAFRVDRIVQTRIFEAQTELQPQIDKFQPQIDKFQPQLDKFQHQLDKLQPQIDKLQYQIDKLRVDLYFGHVASGRVFTPMKAVELRMPDSAIEMVLCGPAEDRSIIGMISYQDGYYEPHVVAALSRLIADSALCIDIGANLGAISLQLSKIASKGHVYSFEPASASFRYLTQNIAANAIDNVTAYNLGVSDQTQDLVLNYISDLSGCSFVIGTADVLPPSEISTAARETIHCIAIDDWISQNNIPAIDFIKLDAEGMELAALRGADRLLRQEKPDLAIEFNPHTNDDFGHGSSRDLYNTLRRYWDQIYLIPRDMSAPLVQIQDFDQLMQLVKCGPGWEDLFCTTDKRQRARADEPTD